MPPKRVQRYAADDSDDEDEESDQNDSADEDWITSNDDELNSASDDDDDADDDDVDDVSEKSRQSSQDLPRTTTTERARIESDNVSAAARNRAAIGTARRAAATTATAPRAALSTREQYVQGIIYVESNKFDAEIDAEEATTTLEGRRDFAGVERRNDEAGFSWKVNEVVNKMNELATNASATADELEHREARVRHHR